MLGWWGNLLEQLAEFPPAVCSEFLCAPPLTAHSSLASLSLEKDTLAVLDNKNSVHQLHCISIRLLGITNRPDSSLATLVDQIIDAHAGIEIELLLPKLCRPTNGVLLFSFDFYRRQTISPTRVQEIITGLRQLPAQIEMIFESQERYIQELTHDFSETKDFIFVAGLTS